MIGRNSKIAGTSLVTTRYLQRCISIATYLHLLLITSWLFCETLVPGKEDTHMMRA